MSIYCIYLLDIYESWCFSYNDANKDLLRKLKLFNLNRLKVNMQCVFARQHCKPQYMGVKLRFEHNILCFRLHYCALRTLFAITNHFKS